MRKQKQTIFCKAVFILLLALFATESLAVINSISVNSNKKNLIIGLIPVHIPPVQLQ